MLSNEQHIYFSLIKDFPEVADQYFDEGCLFIIYAEVTS